MTRKLALTTLLMAITLAAVACSSPGTADTRESGKPPVAVEVVAAAPAEIAQAVDVVGSLAPKFSADVKSEFTALVAEVYVTQWVKVAKGTPLARLDTRDGEIALEAAKAAVMQAEVSETRARRELERALKLKEVGLVTQQMLDDARTGLEAAQATSSAAKAQRAAAETHLAKAIIRAPMDGVVAFRGVSAGDRVENMGSGFPMFRVVDNRVLELTVTVPSTRIASVKVGQPLIFTTDALPGKKFTGTVKFINPSADPATRAVTVLAEVENGADELRGGLFVKGQILTGTRAGVLQIPRTSLLSWDAEKATGEVFVVRGDVAESHTVKTGAATGDAVEIVEGVSAGDKVVTRGGFSLRTGDRVVVSASQGA